MNIASAASVLKSGLYSDFTITCQSEVFKVHRLVVCLQSKPLAAAIDGNFAEGTTLNVDVNEDDPEIVRNLIDFFYTGDYGNAKSLNEEQTVLQPAPKRIKLVDSSTLLNVDSESKRSTATPPADSPKQLISHVETYVIADLWDVQPLKKLAAAKFEKCLVDAWSSPDFANSLRLVYDATSENDRLLKDTALAFLLQNIDALMKRGEFVALLKDKAVIAYELLNAQLKLYAKHVVVCNSVSPSSKKCPWGAKSHAGKVIESNGPTNWYCLKCKEGFD